VRTRQIGRSIELIDSWDAPPFRVDLRALQRENPDDNLREVPRNAFISLLTTGVPVVSLYAVRAVTHRLAPFVVVIVAFH